MADIKDEGKELGQQLMRWVNSGNHGVKEFVKVVTHDHPTLQQCFMRVIMACVEEWSKREYFDARNEATVELCKAIVEKCGTNYYLPFI